MKFVLLPIAIIYGIIVLIRNKLFDWKILPSASFDIPVISVGNISVGGTGKTPHTEYLIRLLNDSRIIAVLSRGYGRKTKGFIAADSFSTASEIGDEPRQFKQNFNDIEVVVCEKRKKGIRTILEKFSNINLILLDDAFQHRWVKPGLSILLTDYFNLYTNDYLLPVGKLREFRISSKRADIIIVTKTPNVFSPILRRSLTESFNMTDNQKLYFSYIKYGDFKLVPGINCDHLPEKHNCILLFTGVANPGPLEEYLERMCIDIEKLKFPDHHKYSVKDMEKIRDIFLSFASPNKIIITTEKDAMRLADSEIIDTIQGLPVYYIPIEIELHEEDKENFNKQILEYVK